MGIIIFIGLLGNILNGGLIKIGGKSIRSKK